MKKSAYISDLIFTFFLGSLIFLCLFRYLKIELWLAFTLSLLCGGFLSAALGAVLRVKRKNSFLKKSDETQKQKLLLHLALLSDNEKTEYFRKFLAQKGTVQRFGPLRLFTKTEFCFLNFNLTPVSPDDIAKYARLKTGKQKVVLCSQIEDSAYALCQRLNIEVKTGEQIYSLLKKENGLPQTFLGEENGESKRSRRMKLWFSRRNARHFLTAAALILLSSLWTPFSYYYLSFGVCLLLTAVFVRVFGKD